MKNALRFPIRTGSDQLFLGLVAVIIGVAIIGIEFFRTLIVQPRSPVADTSITASPFPRQLRDASGQILTLARPPQRIVSQTLGTDEILLALCSPQRIVGLSTLSTDSHYSNVAKEAKTLTVSKVANAEEILRLKPDLIFVASYSRAETVEMLRLSGAPVFRFENFHRIDDIKTNIRTLGYAVGEETRAEALVKQMEQDIDRIRSLIPLLHSSPRIMSYHFSGFTAGANTLFDDLVRTIGAKNASAENGIEGFQKISAEKILEWQPDFLVVGANAGEFEETRRALLSLPAIAGSRAGKTEGIIVIDNRYFLSVSHHIVRAVEALARAVYRNRLEVEK